MTRCFEKPLSGILRVRTLPHKKAGQFLQTASCSFQKSELLELRKKLVSEVSDTGKHDSNAKLICLCQNLIIADRTSGLD